MMKIRAGLFFFILLCLANMLSAQQEKKSLAVREGWYVYCDSLYADAIRFGPANNFERYSGSEDCHSVEKGCWFTRNDSLILIPLWCREYCPHPAIPICMTGVPLIPDTFYMKMTADTFYLNYGRNDHDSDRYVPFQTDTGMIGRQMQKLQETFHEIKLASVEASAQSPVGYYSWSTIRWSDLLELKADGNFSMKDNEATMSGLWYIGHDTLFCEVKKWKGPKGKEAPKELFFFFYEGKLLNEKTEAGKIPECIVYYRVSRLQFTYDWKHD